MTNLYPHFEETFEDELFSRAERKSLRDLVADSQPTDQELGVLRSKLFDFARTRLQESAPIVVLDWLENANKALIQKSAPAVDTRVFFSPYDDCVGVILAQIRAARSNFQVSVFTISDNRIADELIAAHRRKIAVKIITDNDKSTDMGSDVERLAEVGIPVRMDNTTSHMHHKFAIVDNSIAMTGSYNWTRSASKHNRENILLTNDQKAIRLFQKEFDLLWNELTDY